MWVNTLKLYILGNGFDIAHSLKTSYWNFRCFLESVDEKFLEEFESLYGIKPIYDLEHHFKKDKWENIIEVWEKDIYSLLWSNLEYMLGYANDDIIIDEGKDIANNIGLESGPIQIKDTLNDFWRSKFNHYIDRLNGYLFDWIKHINTKGIKPQSRKLYNNDDDFFINFNYTPVLETVYNIDYTQILHIHGGVPPYCDIAPFIGHNNSEIIKKYNNLSKKALDEFDEGLSSIYRELSYYYDKLLKDSASFIRTFNSFFDKLANVDEIFIYGHSLNEIDMPYFEKIKSIVSDAAKWNIYYFKESDKDRFYEAMKSIGVVNCTLNASFSFWES